MAYHMPRDSNTMPICSPSKHECVEKAVGIVEQTAFDVTGRILLNHLQSRAFYMKVRNFVIEGVACQLPSS